MPCKLLRGWPVIIRWGKLFSFSQESTHENRWLRTIKLPTNSLESEYKGEFAFVVVARRKDDPCATRVRFGLFVETDRLRKSKQSNVSSLLYFSLCPMTWR
jgi:hypothetical protein